MQINEADCPCRDVANVCVRRSVWGCDCDVSLRGKLCRWSAGGWKRRQEAEEEEDLHIPTWQPYIRKVVTSQPIGARIMISPTATTAVCLTQIARVWSSYRWSHVTSTMTGGDFVCERLGLLALAFKALPSAKLTCLWFNVSGWSRGSRDALHCFLRRPGTCSVTAFPLWKWVWKRNIPLWWGEQQTCK